MQVRLGPDDLSEVIYTDHYGNALTGLRAHNVPRSAVTAPPMPAFLPKRRLAAPSGTKTVSAWSSSLRRAQALRDCLESAPGIPSA